MDKNKKLVFLFITPFLDAFINKYCLWELIELEYRVVIIDLSKILENKYYNSTSARVAKDTRFEIIQIGHMKQLEKFIKKNVLSSFFFPMFEYIYSARKVFKLLTEYDCNYIYVNTLVSPLFYSQGDNKGIKLTKERLMFSHVRAAIFHRITRKIVSHKEAMAIFFCGKNGEEFYFAEGACGKDTRRHYLYAFDYENLIQAKSVNDSQGSYYVFIDQYIPFHPDNTVHKNIHIDPDTYYKEVGEMLDCLSETTGAKVMIASHPQANYEDKEYFRNYEILYGKTAELVKNARFICTHFSTAAIYAVMLDKPLILLNPPCLHSIEHFQNATDKLTEITGILPVDQIRDAEINKCMKINRENYGRCMTDNIASENPNMEYLWKRIMDFVMEDFSEKST